MTRPEAGATPGILQAPMSPPHGFAADDATRRLLRSRPPQRALDWAGGLLGGTVVSTQALRGGMSSAVHALTICLTGDGKRQVVLRRYVRADADAEQRDAAAREADILGLVEAVAVPTPSLVAVDPSGEHAGVPAVLMSRLPGRVDWAPADLDRWIRSLAALLPTVHEAALPLAGVLGSFAPYAQERYDPPGWARWPRVWERAAELAHEPPPDLDVRFIHRDFHPGNVLWRGGRVTGLVDWQAACAGPASADVAHCRANLFRYGLDVADRFRAAWERGTGERFHPWAEIATIVGFLDGLRDEPGADRFVTEEALAQAVASLGPSS